jgi:hypothetical protein
LVSVLGGFIFSDMMNMLENEDAIPASVFRFQPRAEIAGTHFKIGFAVADVGTQFGIFAAETFVRYRRPLRLDPLKTAPGNRKLMSNRRTETDRRHPCSAQAFGYQRINQRVFNYLNLAACLAKGRVDANSSIKKKAVFDEAGLAL